MTSIREYIDLVESATVPTVLYHGTFEHHLPSIIQHGLGGAVSRRNFDISRKGSVYLTNNPDVADHWARDNEVGTRGEVVVLAVDTAHLNPTLLASDPNDDGDRGGISYEYRGVIPPSALSTLDDLALMESSETGRFRFTETDPRKQQRARVMMENPAFRQWFGQSEVVDQDGLPLMCYHGTASSFAAFRPATGQNGYQLGHGIYVSTTPDYANRWPASAKEGHNVMPLYVSAQKLISAEAYFTGFNERFVKHLADVVGPSYDPDVHGEDHDPDDPHHAEASQRVDAELRAAWGFDGISDGDQIVVFDPSQVKSAYGNRGSFSASGTSIVESNGGKSVPTTLNEIRKLPDPRNNPNFARWQRGAIPSTSTLENSQSRGSTTRTRHSAS